ncbi:hypothetical protein C453_12666 [Haloferax elongans ATCC BAA-1513]|uniref:Uncharacterized protein n=1 Tax=Haloferax elongans ATCC BAA-1513 TaxID=1230453 RepID=M0HKS2_HALEO|nr:hypothetical protein [Haloferax elongans]ELZ84398.1 hypothetical protein C453_12666 [Haloferax elongans ATCC BAA-1513]
MFDTVPPAVASIIALAMTALGAFLAGRKGRAHDLAVDVETELRELFDEQGVFPSPATAEVDRDDVDAALAEAIPRYEESTTIETVFSDGTYLAPVAADVPLLRTLAGGVSWLPYRPERFDCEQYAQAFAVFTAFLAGTNTVGIVLDWSGNHAYNVIVTAAGGVRFYDPYEDTFVAIGEGKYRLENALIIF